MPKSKPLADSQDLTELLPPAAPETSSEPSADAAASEPVHIDFDDVTEVVHEVHAKLPELSDDVQATIAMRAQLQQQVEDTMAAWSRSSEKLRGESDAQHQERIKASFEAAVLAARRQDAAPPAPKQPVPPAILSQTQKEMAAGAKQSAYWAEQSKQRPMPTAKEIKAEGVNTPVFRPGEYMHEKGGVDKNLVTQSMPVR
jgi:hypothetical protein